MNHHQDTPEAVLRDAASLAVSIGEARAERVAAGTRSPVLDAAAARAEAVLHAAGQAAHDTAMVAAMERLDPDEFRRRVRVRRRRDALRKRPKP